MLNVHYMQFSMIKQSTYSHLSEKEEIH